MTSPPNRAQPAKRVKATLLKIEEKGAILDDLLMKVNHNRVRSIYLELALRLCLCLNSLASIVPEMSAFIRTFILYMDGNASFCLLQVVTARSNIFDRII